MFPDKENLTNKEILNETVENYLSHVSIMPIKNPEDISWPDLLEDFTLWLSDSDSWDKKHGWV